MSIDLAYYSFNAKRADKCWETFAYDIVAIKKAYFGTDTNIKPRHKINPLRIQKREEIFKSFADQNLYLEGKKSWKYEGDPKEGNYESSKDDYEDGLMEDLLSHFVTYPGGIKTSAEQNQFVKLDLELASEYEIIPYYIDDDPIAEGLTESQRELKENYGEVYSQDELITFLEDQDIRYGSISNNSFEDKNSASVIMGILSTCGLKQEDGIVLGSEFVRLYENLNKDILNKLKSVLMDDYGWNESEGGEDAEICVLDFLKSMKPIAKDLKENADSILIDGADGYLPKGADQILRDRALKHFEEFKNVLPSVV